MLRRVAFAFVLVSATGLARAHAADDWDICRDENASPDAAITACTKLVNPRRSKGNELALAYYNRAISYKQKGDIERALNDYNESIRINPAYAKAFNNRGNLWRDKGELERAIADYSEAIKLDANYAAAYANRGDV